MLSCHCEVLDVLWTSFTVIHIKKQNGENQISGTLSLHTYSFLWYGMLQIGDYTMFLVYTSMYSANYYFLMYMAYMRKCCDCEKISSGDFDRFTCSQLPLNTNKWFWNTICMDVHLSSAWMGGRVFFIFSIQEFNHSRSVNSESEHLASRTGHLQNGPKTQNVNFCENGSNDFD
jgi:hypothetical protein